MSTRGRMSADLAIASWRRARLPVTVAFVASAVLLAASVAFNVADRTHGRRLLFGAALLLCFDFAVITFMAWMQSTPAGWRRTRRVRARAGSVYHDPSPTRKCPRCGLPMDRVFTESDAIGPPSPRELCHRCLHADDIDPYDEPTT